MRIERDVLQNELTKRQEQLKLERQMLREKFEIEKQMLNKAWQEKLAMVFSTPPENLEKHLSEKTLINATADAMVFMSIDVDSYSIYHICINTFIVLSDFYPLY